MLHICQHLYTLGVEMDFTRNGDPERIHQTCWPPYVDKWKSRTSPTIENPKGEKCQSLFTRVPKIILGLEEGKRIFNLSDC